MTPSRPDTARERGQVVLIFALLIPVLLALCAFVIGIGNWYVHGKKLQTKADAGAFAGATGWGFPCQSEIDTRIEALARAYAGSNNPQVGGVPNSSIHTVLNGSAWYDDDSNPAPVERNDPLNASVCAANILDVKVTEDNSFPLASLIPLFPDIKRRARVEIQEAEGITGLLPIATRAPVPDSMAAVFYNQQNGNILGVKYFVQNNGITGLPGGLQGWSTLNSEDMAGSWANFAPPAASSVAIAISFRGACNTNLPNGNTKIKTANAPNCFEDEGFSTVNQLCNQGSAYQIVNCYYTDPNGQPWPNENVLSGLQFIRGYPTPTVSNGPPQLQDAWLENQGDCLVNGTAGTGYFNAHPSNGCHARLRVVVDTGSVMEDPPGNPVQVVQTRVASNVEVKYTLVRSDGSTFCNYGNNCELQPSSPNASGDVTYSTTGGNPYQNLDLTAGSRANAVAIQIRVKGSTVSPNPGNCGPGLNGFNNNCRWYHTGTGQFGTSVAPNNAQILAAPVQQAFRGLSTYSSSVQWLTLTQSSGCNQLPDLTNPLSAAARTGGNRCFIVDLGLKGGIAVSANDQPILFNDGTGSSQMGALDCDPNIPQGQILEDGVIKGCSPWYARHLFDVTPLCPAPNSLFQQPNPGPPWTNWPPLRCIKTRPTGSMNQLEKGLKGRFFGNKNANQCPGGANGGPQFIKGRNYWDKDTSNGYTGTPPYGYAEGTHGTNFNPGDPRIVTIFLTTTDGFTGNGQKTYPITGFIEIYITGFGRIQGNGINIDDPCPGNATPNDLDLGGGNGSGYAVWGHILNWVIPAPGATPSGRICNPGRSAQPCVAVLVD